MSDLLTSDDVRALLRTAAGENRAKWAAAVGIAPAYITDVLNRRREPGEKILEALGLERLVHYQRKEHDG